MASNKPAEAPDQKGSRKFIVSESSDEGTRIPTAMLPKALYADIICLAAFNKIKKSGPRNDSAILREALSFLFNEVGFSSKIDILAKPKPSYVKALAKVHEKATLEGGIRKTFSISESDYETAEAFASYNKLHGLLPKNISQVCRDALTLYINSIDYKFRPE